MTDEQWANLKQDDAIMHKKRGDIETITVIDGIQYVTGRNDLLPLSELTASDWDLLIQIDPVAFFETIPDDTDDDVKEVSLEELLGMTDTAYYTADTEDGIYQKYFIKTGTTFSDGYSVKIKKQIVLDYLDTLPQEEVNPTEEENDAE